MSRITSALVLVLTISVSMPALAQDGARGATPEATPEADAPGPDERAQDPRELEARVQLEVGRTLASEGRCELAVPRLERALELSGAIDARFHLGACLHALGRHAEAMDQLERFTRQVDPDVDLERSAIALRILERAAAEVGSIALVIEPPSALVTIDGRAVVGTGQRIVRVDAGRHVIRAEYVGHEPIARTVDVAPGARELRLLQLQRRAPATGWLEVDSDPDAVVQVNGRVLRPGHAIELRPGWHRVRAAAPGRAPREREVEILAGERVRLELELPERRDDAAIILGTTGAVVGSILLGIVIGVAASEGGNGGAGGPITLPL